MCTFQRPTDDAFDIRRFNANAALISAAPDLYAALDGLLGLTEGNIDGWQEIRAARAALAKARGETE